MDVYVGRAGGGVPRRLTWHPGRGPRRGLDARRQGACSSAPARTSFHYFDRLFTVPARRRPARRSCRCPAAVQGSFSPDGKRLAYVPLNQWQPAWKRYRGGQTTPVWIADLADSAVEKVPRENSNDSCPMWVGDRVYFLSDRDGPVALFAYDTKTKQVSEVVKNDGLDFKSASAGPDALVYEQFGSLFLYDLAHGALDAARRRALRRLPGGAAALREGRTKKLAAPALSPTGKRVAFEARGEILTVPAEKGDIRNLTRSPARRRPRPGLVARREEARLALGRVRRVRAARRATRAASAR